MELTNGSLQVDEGATFAITLAKKVSNNSQIIIDFDTTINCYGNLSITNNKIINLGESTTRAFLTYIRIFNNKKIKIGDGIITIKDNKSYKDDGTSASGEYNYMNYHMTQVYGTSKDMNCLYEMISGKKFNLNN